MYPNRTPNNANLELDLGRAIDEQAVGQTTREINKRIREEAKEVARHESKKSKSAGAGLSVLSRVQKRHPNNPKQQAAMFFGEFVITAGTGRMRPISARTSTTYSDGFMRMLDDLRDDNAQIRNLGELGKTHALRLISYWQKQGQSVGTIQNKISRLRRFLTFIGKPQVVPTGSALKELLEQKGISLPGQRRLIPTISKAWDESHVNVHTILGVLRQSSPICAIQLEMQAAFGLRIRESFCLNPKASDYGDTLRVMYGTKGGLPRDVPFDQDPHTRAWQRDVLERAKFYAAQNRKGVLAAPGKTLQQSKDLFHYQMRKVGICRAKLGVTAHGLRHQYAARRYEELSGMKAPVSAHAQTSYDESTLEADYAARAQVSVALGHFRPDVTKAYVGSIPLMSKHRQAHMQQWIDLTEKNQEFQTILAQADIHKAWLAGKVTQGHALTEHDELRLIVGPANGQPMHAVDHQQLTQQLAQLYARPIDLSEHYEENGKAQWVEIYLQVGEPTCKA